jgi:hypothetical protein
MTGEIALGGVYLPSLLVLAVGAAVVTGILTRILSHLGAYRLVTYRPLVDLALFVVVLGLLSLLTAPSGTR